jgi:hypothetical protein
MKEYIGKVVSEQEKKMGKCAALPDIGKIV